MPATRRSQTLAPLMLGFVVATGVFALAVLRPPSAARQAAVHAPVAPAKTRHHSAEVQRCSELAKSIHGGTQADWEDALKTCETAAAQDPHSLPVQQVLKLARNEAAGRDRVARAKDLITQGQMELALKTLDGAKPGVPSWDAARDLFVTTARAQKRKFGEACLDFKARHQLDLAWTACKRFEDYACSVGFELGDKAIDQAFLNVERLRNDSYEPTCLGEAFKPRQPMDAHPPDTPEIRKLLLADAYRDRDIGESAYRYSVDAQDGLKAFKACMVDGDDRNTCATLYADAKRALDSHQRISLLLRTHALDSAGDALNTEAGADRDILRVSESAMYQRDRETLAEQYAVEGLADANQKHAEDGFGRCLEGYKLSPTNARVSTCIQAMQAEAMTIDHSTCAGASRVVKLTLEDSALYAEARAKLATCPLEPR